MYRLRSRAPARSIAAAGQSSKQKDGVRVALDQGVATRHRSRPARSRRTRDVQALCGEQRGDGVGLGRADLDRRHAAGGDQAGELRGDDAVIVQPVGAGEQRGRRFVIADLGGQRFVGRDIGRVAKDQVEALLDRRRPIALR